MIHININRIILAPEERHELEQFGKTAVHSAKLAVRAKIILALDTAVGREVLTQEEVAQKLDISRKLVNDARRDFLAADSVSVFLRRKKRAVPPVKPKVTGELEAQIIALACGEIPQGYARWTLRLLTSKCVELHYADSLSYMTVSRILKKHNLSLD